MINRRHYPVDPWRLVEAEYTSENLGKSETFFSLSNGYLGLRGNNSEGRDSVEHGTFVNGFHETWRIHHAETAYGFAEIGQTIINAPDAKVIRLYVDDEPLSMENADFREYERSLDFRDGVLRRHLIWQTPSGKRVRIDTERIVSFTERHLAVMRYRVELLDADAPVALSCQVINRQDGHDEYGRQRGGAAFDPRKAETISGRVLDPGEYWQLGSRSVLSYRAHDSGMTLAVAVDHVIDTECEYTEHTLIEPDIAKNVFRVQGRRGVPITITKTIAYHTSRGVPTRELIDRCRRTLDRIAAEGVDVQLQRQRCWLDEFWTRSDVIVEGHPDVQQAVRWNLFQLIQASARADGLGIPAKGLTGSGYSGHYFWDTEIYVLPFLTYTNPLFARNALTMRYRMLPNARQRALELNEHGALFPWRTINGLEASAYYAAGTAQYHIDADVTYAIAKYVSATGDFDFLARQGAEIVVETARMWVTLGFWRDDDTFHIHGVTGPDEYTAVVNDNLFTNVMARFNLRYAATIMRQLERELPEEFAALADRLRVSGEEITGWDTVADAIAVPFNDNLGIHPQDAHFLEREVWDLPHTPSDQRPLLLHFHPLVIYRFQVLKQTDIVLALFLLGDEFAADQKKADFDYYDPLTTGDSTLSSVVQCIMAAEVGYQGLALEYFNHSLYVDLADLHHNSSDGVHVASTGGVWSALVCGFGGMRDYKGQLSFDPRLPLTWPRLTFHLTWHCMPLTVSVTREDLTVTAAESDAPDVEFSVRGVAYRLASGQSVTVPLDGQGPSLPGKPTLRALRGNRRDDGTLITASVPTITAEIPIISENDLP